MFKVIYFNSQVSNHANHCFAHKETLESLGYSKLAIFLFHAYSDKHKYMSYIHSTGKAFCNFNFFKYMPAFPRNLIKKIANSVVEGEIF